MGKQRPEVMVEVQGIKIKITTKTNFKTIVKEFADPGLSWKMRISYDDSECRHSYFLIFRS